MVEFSRAVSTHGELETRRCVARATPE
jgi:hypothetical protein